MLLGGSKGVLMYAGYSISTPNCPDNKKIKVYWPPIKQKVEWNSIISLSITFRKKNIPFYNLFQLKNTLKQLHDTQNYLDNKTFEGSRVTKLTQLKVFYSVRTFIIVTKQMSCLNLYIK